MNSILRYTSAFALAAVFLIPSLAAAQTSIYSDSQGNFQYTSNNFSFGFGSGGGYNCGANNICQVASTILFIINFVLVPVIFAIAFIVFLWGVFLKYIYSHGDPDKVSEGHKLILWGIIGFVVMISIWGLVNVVANTFGLAGYYAPPTPTSY
jgi:hypothetical protein